MIKYHILSLLALALAALTAIESAANFFEESLKKNGNWYASVSGWVMLLVSAGAVALYIRTRALRKREVMNPKTK